MTNIEVLLTEITGLDRQELEHWITHEFVRPDVHDGEYVFHEIDVARVRLIKDLRDDMKVEEGSIPIVLSLLDQLYEMRRRMNDLCEAINTTTPDDIRKRLAEHLANHAS
tara:strand:- start:1318 stop:1647 length:330 start_codon:yes stop_codon:yes gene_type:complete